VEATATPPAAIPPASPPLVTTTATQSRAPATPPEDSPIDIVPEEPVVVPELVRSAPDAAQAEACFQAALDVARQEAKSWELRAALSLARLWQQQGKRAEARELSAPIYNWFTEGFDTADLQEAKVLLEELG
jgi:hypothetical protein